MKLYGILISLSVVIVLVFFTGTIFLVRVKSHQNTYSLEAKQPSNSSYQEFNLSYLQSGLKSEEKNILLFKTNWCGSCKGLEQDIEAKLDQIPKNIKIFWVDYDTNPEINKKYQVLTQHTIVQINEKGEMIKTWTGSPDLESLLSELI